MAQKTSASPSSGGPRPLWIPPGLKFDSLPENTRRAITEIIDPLYQELVLAAPNGFERAIGNSYVQMAWLELIEQIQFGNVLETALPRGTGLDDQGDRIDRLLRIIACKDKSAKFLLELRKRFDRLGDIDPLGKVYR